MAASLEQILGYVNLLGLIERIKTGIPQPVPDQFFSTTKQIIGVSGKYTRVYGTRTVARRVEYGAPSVRRALKGVEDIPVRLIHTHEHIHLDPIVLRQLRAYDSYELNLGKQEIARQVKEFVINFTNLRTAAVLQSLSLGAIYFDSAGNLLPSSSGAAVTVDYAVPANNQNQLNGVVDKTWADSTANIPRQLTQLQETALQTTGYEIEVAFYGRNIPTYLAQNDYVAEFAVRNPAVNQEYLMGAGKKLGGSIPQGYLGVKHWIPVNTAFFEDANGTNQTIFGADKIVFTPAISSDWYEMLEGSYEVPTTLNMLPDAQQALNACKTVQGMFAYSKLMDDPPGIKMNHGDTFLPVIKVPASIYQATVAGF